MDLLKRFQTSVRKHWADDRGASLVVVAVAFTGIIAMTALLVDGGYAYGQRRQMQNAADAAALAGMRAYYLQRSPSEAAREAAARNAAMDYARLNLADDATITFPSAKLLQVETRRTFDPFFARALGYETLTASAIARAAVNNVKEACGMWPVAVRLQTITESGCYHPNRSPVWTEGCEVEVWNDQNDAPGNAGWLDWDDNPDHPVDDYPCPPNGGGSKELQCALNRPNASGCWEVGWWVNGSDGIKNSQDVRAAIAAWEGAGHVTVPVWDEIQGSGSNAQYKIAMFAEFQLTGSSMTGSPKWIKGQFMNWTEPGVAGDDECDTGYCSIHLVP